jgi:hypothetical protein
LRAARALLATRRMSRHALRSLSLFILFALPAAAQDYGISGHDVAGRASIGRDGAVRLHLETYSKRGTTTRDLTARVVARQGDDLTLEYQDVVKVDRSVIDVLLGRPAARVETVRAALRAGRDGLRGAVAGAEATWVRQDALANTTILVVPGLSTNLWNQYGVPYLDENLAALRARGLSARRLAINTEESIAVNAQAIAAEVRAEVARGHEVLLLAHSKGGADTITALSDPRNEDLLPHVRGLMAVQPVYGGSPIADLVGSSCLIQKTVDLFFERALPAINRETDVGSRDAVQDLRHERRQALLALHPYPVDRVPTVVVRSSFHGRSMWRPRHVLRQPLWVFETFLEKTKGIASDGMVSLEWQRVPGARDEVTLDDMDHFEPGFRGESPHSPCEVTNLLVDRMVRVLAAR